jgi:hypothetical protein
LKWIVLRELHRGVALGLWFVVCSAKFREVLHRVSRSFFEVDCVERVTQRRFTLVQVSDLGFVVGFCFRLVTQSLLRQFAIARVAKFLHRVSRSFLNGLRVSELHRGVALGLGVGAQSFAKFYTEFRGVF